MTIEQARKIIQVRPPYTEEDIKRAYARLAFECHPDRGGSVEEFRRLTEARDVLLRANKAQNADNVSDRTGIADILEDIHEIANSLSQAEGKLGEYAVLVSGVSGALAEFLKRKTHK